LEFESDKALEAMFVVSTSVDRITTDFPADKKPNVTFNQQYNDLYESIDNALWR
jgi:hypothetical protein